MSVVQIRQSRVYSELFNGDDGVTGLVPELRRLISESVGAQNEQAKRHQQNSSKLNIIMAICALATLLVLAVSVVVTWEVAKHAELDPAKIFHANALIQAYNSSQHADGLPPIHY